MNKYNPKELNAAIKEAIRKGIKEEGMYNCLMFIPSNVIRYLLTIKCLY